MDRFSAVVSFCWLDEPWSSLLVSTHLEVSLVRFSVGSSLSREVNLLSLHCGMSTLDAVIHHIDARSADLVSNSKRKNIILMGDSPKERQFIPMLCL